MKRFKQYLTEGWGNVKRNYLKTGKITDDDYKWMKIALDDWGHDYSGKLAEWFAAWWIKNKQDVSWKKIYFTNTTDQTVVDFLESIGAYYVLMKSGAVKNPPPTNKDMKGIIKYIQDVDKKYYSAKKMKIPSGVKAGVDYEEVKYKNGIQVWKIYTFEGAKALGGGCNWCIRRDRTHWQEYNFQYNFCFYFVRNHRLNSADANYKIAVAVDDYNEIDSIYDKDDNEKSASAISFIKNLAPSLWETFDREMYTADHMKFLNKRFKEWMKDLDKLREQYKIDKVEYAETHVEWIYFKNVGKDIDEKINVIESQIEDIKANIEIKSKQQNENVQINMFDLDQNKLILKGLEVEKKELEDNEDYYIWKKYKDNPLEYFEEEDMENFIEDDFMYNYFDRWDSYVSDYEMPEELAEFYEQMKVNQDQGASLDVYLREYIMDGEREQMRTNFHPNEVLDYFYNY